MNDGKIFVLTGPVRMGKTSRLMEWIKDRDDVNGILTPVIDGTRFFYDIAGKKYFQMEATPSETEFFRIGKYVFSRDSFSKAEKIISDGTLINSGWLVIDEIGPLELNGEGFSLVLKKILTIKDFKFNLVLVIRDKIFEEVVNEFNIISYKEF